MFLDTPLLSSFPPSATLISTRSGQSCSRDELAVMVNDRTAALALRCLRRGDRVVIAEPDGLEFLAAVFACWVGGFCAVAVNPSLKPEEWSRVIESTGASAWLGQSGPGLPLARRASPQGPAPLLPDEPALILMTSGTTGIPKGVTHSLRSLAARIDLNRRYIGDHALRRSLCVLPVFFGHGLIGNCLTPLASGASLSLWPSPSVAELAGFGAALDRLGTTFFSSVPTFWRIMPKISASPVLAPERVHVGSAPLSLELWKSISDWCKTTNVHNMFGMTETANWIGGGPLQEAEGRDGYVGQPWGGKLAVLIDGKVQNLGTGEVLIASPSIMQGFWQQPEMTRASFAGDWFRSGDIGTLDTAGALTLKGRIKSEINRGGLKILAEEIDMLLERHPDIAEACTFAIDDPISGEAVAAAIVLHPGTAFEATTLRKWCAGRVRAEAVPARLYPVAKIPRNDRGKIVRAQVRDAILGKGSH